MITNKKESNSSYKNVYYIPKLRKLLHQANDLILKEARPTEEDRANATNNLKVIYNELVKEALETPQISNKQIIESF